MPRPNRPRRAAIVSFVPGFVNRNSVLPPPSIAYLWRSSSALRISVRARPKDLQQPIAGAKCANVALAIIEDCLNPPFRGDVGPDITIPKVSPQLIADGILNFGRDISVRTIDE